MANLDVTRKKKSPLPWILLILVILAIAGYFIWQQYYDKEAEAGGNVNTTQDATYR